MGHDPDAAAAAVQASFDGPVLVAEPGLAVTIGGWLGSDPRRSPHERNQTGRPSCEGRPVRVSGTPWLGSGGYPPRSAEAVPPPDVLRNRGNEPDRQGEGADGEEDEHQGEARVARGGRRRERVRRRRREVEGRRAGGGRRGSL